MQPSIPAIPATSATFFHVHANDRDSVTSNRPNTLARTTEDIPFIRQEGKIKTIEHLSQPETPPWHSHPPPP